MHDILSTLLVIVVNNNIKEKEKKCNSLLKCWIHPIYKTYKAYFNDPSIMLFFCCIKSKQLPFNILIICHFNLKLTVKGHFQKTKVKMSFELFR